MKSRGPTLSGQACSAPLCASWSGAFHAFFHRVALRVPVGRGPCARRRRLPRRAGVAAGAQRTPSVPSRRATGLRAIHARGRACRNRLGRSGFGDSTGRVGRLRAGRVACRQGGTRRPWPGEFQRAMRWRTARVTADRNAAERGAVEGRAGSGREGGGGARRGSGTRGQRPRGARGGRRGGTRGLRPGGARGANSAGPW